MACISLRALSVGTNILAPKLTCLCDGEAIINKKKVQLKQNDCLMLMRRIGPGNTTTLVVERENIMYRVSPIDYSCHEITLHHEPKVKITSVRVDSHMQFDVLK